MKKIFVLASLFACIWKANAQTDTLPQTEIGPLFYNITLSEEYLVWIDELKKQKENFSDTTLPGENVQAAFIIKNFNAYLNFTTSITYGYIIVGVYTYDKKEKTQYVAIRLRLKDGTTKEQARDAYYRIGAKMKPLFKYSMTGTPKKFTIKHFVQHWPPEQITPLEVGYGYDKNDKAWYLVLAIKKSTL
jgi:hypothetical protein